MSEGRSIPKVSVIAPDHGSGESFLEILEKHSLDVTQKDHEISPRVVDGEHTNTDILAVASDLAEAIIKEINEGIEILTIACNTLSLPIFVNKALQLVDDYINSSEKSFELILTIPQITQYIENNPEKRMIILGTMPLSRILAEEEFQLPTFVKFDGATDFKALRLVQEIIWRVKAIQGSDTTTAPIYNNIDEEEELANCSLELDALLNELGIEEVVMGCTELPFAFEMLKQKLGRELKYKLIDPATLVGEEIKKRQAAE